MICYYAAAYADDTPLRHFSAAAIEADAAYVDAMLQIRFLSFAAAFAIFTTLADDDDVWLICHYFCWCHAAAACHDAAYALLRHWCCLFHDIFAFRRDIFNIIDARLDTPPLRCHWCCRHLRHIFTCRFSLFWYWCRYAIFAFFIFADADIFADIAFVLIFHHFRYAALLFSLSCFHYWYWYFFRYFIFLSILIRFLLHIFAIIFADALFSFDWCFLFRFSFFSFIR